MVHWWWTGVLCEPLDIDMKVANDSFLQPRKYNCSLQNKYCYQQHFMALHCRRLAVFRENHHYWLSLINHDYRGQRWTWIIYSMAAWCVNKNTNKYKVKIAPNCLENHFLKKFCLWIQEGPNNVQWKAFFKFWDFYENILKTFKNI